MITTELDLDLLKKMYNKFKDTNEENIKIHVVSKFLEMLGYDSSEFYYEHSMFHKDGRADIAVKIDDITYLYIEVKSPNNKLSEKEQSQLAQYLHDRSLSWGILTNGKKFILFNDSIKPIPNPNRSVNIDKVVLEIDIFNHRHKDLITYFRKENIFDNKITNYFKDIAQFKALKYPDGGGSWLQYKGTLNNFFKYYANSQKRYRELNQIRIDEFEEFLNIEFEKAKNKENYNGKNINSIETFKNKYSHIRAFFQTLKVKSHGFDEEKTQLIKRINVEEKNTEKSEILNDENIDLILDFYEKRQKTYSIRNKCIFLLCLCYGFERSTLLKLTFDSVKKDKIIIENRELVIPPKLLSLLDELKQHNKQNKVKGNYLFYSKYRDIYSPISEGQINYVFDTLESIDKNNSVWKTLNPAYIRAYLIKQLFRHNYSIEEIVYITGTDLLNLPNLISYDEIVEQVKERGKKAIKTHPFEKFLH
jgi:integrase/recombinase XerD